MTGPYVKHLVHTKIKQKTQEEIVNSALKSTSWRKFLGFKSKFSKIKKTAKTPIFGHFLRFFF